MEENPFLVLRFQRQLATEELAKQTRGAEKRSPLSQESSVGTSTHTTNWILIAGTIDEQIVYA